jgi:osmotically inducible lipoprotein OsmB
MQSSTAHSLRMLVLVVPLIGLLTACGTLPGDRAVTGGALGAVTGAALTAATGGNEWAGALLGGAIGAAAGAATSPRTVYLGPSPFR